MKHARRKSYRRRISRNPPKMTSAMKAKISRAIKAAHRRGVYGKGRRTTAIVRSPRATVRRSRRSASATRTIVVRSRGRSPRAITIRRRRSGGVRGLAPTSLGGMLSVFNRQTLTIAAGAATAGLATSYIITNYGRSLPGVSSTVGSILYRVGIPIGLAYATRRFSRSFSDGLVIGGMVMLVNTLIGQFLMGTAPATAPAATAAYPVSPASPLATMGEYLDPVGESVFDSNSAFATDAWA